MPCSFSTGMKFAIAHWQNRVSPVFDVSDNLLLVDIVNGRELHRESGRLRCRDPFERAREVSALGVELLLCGAVSRVLETALIAAGIRVVGFLRGDIDTVVDAFLKGKLENVHFQLDKDGPKLGHAPGGRSTKKA
jgi:predicted Fe-Mo cluster-binding NifX family protein